jgi:hypothetical protein
MTRWPQFSLGYLMLLMLWWAVELSMFRAIFYYGGSDWRGPVLVMFSPIVMGAAHGGLVLKMRFGFIAGCVLSTLMWLWVAFASQVIRA